MSGTRLRSAREQASETVGSSPSCLHSDECGKRPGQREGSGFSGVPACSPKSFVVFNGSVSPLRGQSGDIHMTPELSPGSNTGFPSLPVIKPTHSRLLGKGLMPPKCLRYLCPCQGFS